MAFHYIRKYGSEGTLQRIDGFGTKGISLRRFCFHHNLSLRSSLEILAFVADIVSDAMKNSFIHGDISSENINILQDGSIILNGYGRPRRQTLAPEGTLSIPGDVYSLGVLMLEILSGQSDIELPLEETMHNQKVLEIFLSIDWKEWNTQPFLPTMQEYLISLLFFDPSSRPHPLDVANILSEALHTAQPPSLPEFIHQNNIQIQDQKEQLAEASTLRSSIMTPVEVTADSSQGVATGFWSRDKIAKMFQSEMTEDQAVQEEWKPPEQHQQSHQPPPPQDIPPPSVPSYNQNQNNFDQPPTLHQAPGYRELRNSTPPSNNGNYGNPPLLENNGGYGYGIPIRKEQTTSEPASLHQAPPPRLQNLNQTQAPHWEQNQNQGFNQGFNQTPYGQPNQIQQNHFTAHEVTAPPTIPDLPSIQNLNRTAPPELKQSIPTHQSIQAQSPYQSQPPQEQVRQHPIHQISIGAGQQHSQMHQGQIGQVQHQQTYQQQPTPQLSIGSGQHQNNNHRSGEPLTGGANKKLLLIIGGAGLFLFLILTGITIALMFKDDKPENETTKAEDITEKEEPANEPTEKPTEEPSEEDEPVKALIKEPAKEPVKKSVKKSVKEPVKPRTTSSKNKTTSVSKATKTPNQKETAPPKTSSEPIDNMANKNFEITVNFSGQDNKISCNEYRGNFDSSTQFTVKSLQYCKVETEDGAKGVFRVHKSMTVNCRTSGNRVNCTPQ